MNGRDIMNLNIIDTKNVDIYDMFYQTYLEDKEKALRWMIYLRDIKDGFGMRVISSILLKLQKDDLHMAMKIAQSDIEQFGRYDDIIKELNEAKANFLQGAVEDNKAYMLIVNAYKLPKSSEEEKEIRRKAIQNAGIEAAKVPLSNALLNKKVNKIGKKLLEKSNPACITDLQAGVDLSHIGINMGKSNVKANLPLIKDEKIVKNFEEEIKNL